MINFGGSSEVNVNGISIKVVEKNVYINGNKIDLDKNCSTNIKLKNKTNSFMKAIMYFVLGFIFSFFSHGPIIDYLNSF